MFDVVLSADVSQVTSSVELLAQGRAGGGWGNSGVSTVDNLVTTLLQIIGAVIGIGFFVSAALAGFGKGDTNQKGREAAIKIAWGVGLAAIFIFIPTFFGEAKGLLGSVF